MNENATASVAMLNGNPVDRVEILCLNTFAGMLKRSQKTVVAANEECQRQHQQMNQIVAHARDHSVDHLCAYLTKREDVADVSRFQAVLCVPGTPHSVTVDLTESCINSCSKK